MLNPARDLTVRAWGRVACGGPEPSAWQSSLRPLAVPISPQDKTVLCAVMRLTLVGFMLFGSVLWHSPAWQSVGSALKSPTTARSVWLISMCWYRHHRVVVKKISTKVKTICLRARIKEWETDTGGNAKKERWCFKCWPNYVRSKSSELFISWKYIFLKQQEKINVMSLHRNKACNCCFYFEGADTLTCLMSVHFFTFSNQPGT